MATKAYSILTFFLLLSGYLVHYATAARVIWLTPSPPWTGRHAWLTPSPPLPQPEHSGDKDTLGTMDEPRGEPYTRGRTRGNPYTRPPGNPYTRAPAPAIPTTRVPSEAAVVSYHALRPIRPAVHCRDHKYNCPRGGTPPGKP